jgi:uncharacterized protein with HEPN domain
MGKSVKNVPPEVRSMRGEIPWREIARMRDKCIHFYFGVDYEVVWNIIKDHLPLVRTKVLSLLDELRQAAAEEEK